jgi:hypothetical protein
MTAKHDPDSPALRGGFLPALTRRAFLLVSAGGAALGLVGCARGPRVDVAAARAPAFFDDGTGFLR